MAQLYADYQKTGLASRITFNDYLRVIGFNDPSADLEGMDDGVIARRDSGGMDLFRIPDLVVRGALRVVVLLVDFDDQVGRRPRADFEDLLFSKGHHPTGSLLDYFAEVSRDAVQIEGSVHGWLRLPKPYSYYTNGSSGTDARSYPRNAQGMAEDAVRAALDAGVEFPRELDKFGNGVVTALFIVHAGRGAEVMPPALRGREIWSHKWYLRAPVSVGQQLQASIYLTVPEDCQLGVCAHELGHLAFQWDDFYDANYADDGQYWDGSGAWDLMAGGSYNGAGARPAHPAGLHKSQHGWIPIQTIAPGSGTTDLVLPPYGSPDARVVKLRSDAFGPRQYLLLENRQRKGFDTHLPAAGLLVWRVDEDQINTNPAQAGLVLVEADGGGQLSTPYDRNDGDDGDPFPGRSRRTAVGPTGTVSTSFPGGPSSRIELRDIAIRDDGAVTLTVVHGIASAPRASDVAPRLPLSSGDGAAAQMTLVEVATLMRQIAERLAGAGAAG